MLQTILLVAMILISVALAGVILIQRSEGGALGMGGGPSGFMTARGAGNLLTRATWILAGLFFVCALSLTILGNVQRSNTSVVDAASVGELAAPPSSSQPQEQAPAAAPGASAQPTFQDLESSLSGSSAPAATPASPPPAQPAPAK